MTSQPDKLTLAFIRKHHVMTLATVSEGRPWCANLFYAFDAESVSFVFTSDRATRHGSEMMTSGEVARTIRDHSLKELCDDIALMMSKPMLNQL